MHPQRAILPSHSHHKAILKPSIPHKPNQEHHPVEGNQSTHQVPISPHQHHKPNQGQEQGHSHRKQEPKASSAPTHHCLLCSPSISTANHTIDKRSVDSFHKPSFLPSPISFLSQIHLIHIPPSFLSTILPPRTKFSNDS